MKTDELTARRGCWQFIKSLITNNALFLLLLVTITCLSTGTAVAQTWRLTGPPEFVQSQDDPFKGGIFQPGTSRKTDDKGELVTTTLNSRTANSAAFTTTHGLWGTGTITYSWDSPPEILHTGDVVAFNIRWSIGAKWRDFCPNLGTLVHLDWSEDWHTKQWYGYSNHPVSPASGQERNTVIKVTSNNAKQLLFYVDVHSTPGDVRVLWTYRLVEGDVPPSSGAVTAGKTTSAAMVNLARGKPATQSSTGYGGTADRGVDGVKDGGYGFHTENEKNPSWQVDLGAVKSLGEIRIFNRRDCCSERARTIQVLLSDDGVNWKRVFSNPGTVFGTDGTPLRVSVKGLSARFVRLQLTEAEYFHLDEVEVYGGNVNQPISTSPPQDNDTISSVNLALNLARGKGATQSSTGYGGTADRGVDGVKDGGYGFHTENEKNPSWQVDLGAVKSLGEIRIFNRRDCCSERARTIQVLLSDDGVNWQRVFSNPGTVFGTDGAPLRVSVKGLSARFVRLQLTEAEYFHLDEVEVYGSDVL